MIIAFLRTIVLYISVMISMRIMGKRQLGEMQPFELVVTIMISDLASVPMQNMGVPLLNGVISILTLVVMEVTFSYITLKSNKARSILVGRPSVLVKNGEIDMDELGKLRFNIDDLLEEIRKKNISDLKDVELAIIETDGGFSVIPKASARPVTMQDIGKQDSEDELPYEIILDGHVISHNLKKCNISNKKLKKMLKSQGINSISDVAVATFTNKNGLTVKGK